MANPVCNLPPGIDPPVFPPVPPLQPPPQACAGLAFPLGFPRIGSREWCQLAELLLAWAKKLGAWVMDWLINGLDKAEKFTAPWANVDITDPASCGGSWKFVSGGALSLPADIMSFLSKLATCVVDVIKWGLGSVAHWTAHGIKALVCMLRAGQVQPGYMDYATALEIWTLRYIWKTLKQLRLSSPDFLGVQTVGADVEDFFEQVLVYLERQVVQMSPPSCEQAIECFLWGTIDEIQFRCWMQLSGAAPEVWFPVVLARRQKLMTDEIVESTRRSTLQDATLWQGANIITDAERQLEATWSQQSIAGMRYAGWLYVQDAGPRYTLYDEIPTITDHLRWLARNIDDRAYVREYHLLDGFTDPVTTAGFFPEAQGQYASLYPDRDFWKEFGLELRTQGMRKVDALRHYAAHWIPAAPTQMQQWVWRLRPDRVKDEWDAEVTKYLEGKGFPPELMARAQQFTIDDFRRLLNEQDVAPLNALWYLQTVYHVPALSYIRDMYRYGVIGEEALRDYHLKLGYAPKDSERFVEVDSAIKSRIRTAEASGWTPSATSVAFGLGQIDEPAARHIMELQGFNKLEIDGMLSRAGYRVKARVLQRALSFEIGREIATATSAYYEGAASADATVKALGAIGITKSMSEQIVSVTALRRYIDLLKKRKAAVRKAYMKGSINDVQLQQALVNLGLDANVAAEFAATWAVEKLGSSKTATKAELVKFAKEGIVDLPTLVIQLTNLGYAPDEITMVQADVMQATARLAAKAAVAEQKAAARDAAQKARAVAAEQRTLARAEALAQRKLAQETIRAQRAAKAAQAHLMKEQPVATLERWAALGIISHAYFTERLTAYEFDEATIENLWKAACQRKSAACQENGQVASK